MYDMLKATPLKQDQLTSEQEKQAKQLALVFSTLKAIAYSTIHCVVAFYVFWFGLWTNVPWSIPSLLFGALLVIYIIYEIYGNIKKIGVKDHE